MAVMIWAAAATLAIGIGACSRSEDVEVSGRLDRIEQGIASLDKQMKGLQARSAPERARRPRPSPDKTYSIPVAGAPFKGPEDALVTVVKGYEFACGYCEKARGLVDQILDAYPQDVRVVYKTFVVHPQSATIPALAGCAAAEQGKFAAMEKLIWDEGFKKRRLDEGAMLELAGKAGLDIDRFSSAMKGEACRQRIAEDQAQLAAVGVSGTPSFYVNGRTVTQRSFEAFAKLIDEELAVAKKRVAAGGARAQYYEEWVVKRGQKQL